MRIPVLILVGALIATPAFAQGERGTSTSAPVERGYVLGTGGFDSSSTSVAGSASSLMSGIGAGQAGVRVAPHVLAFGELGGFKDLEPAGVQSSVNTAVSSLAADQGLDVTATSRMPATYGLGGARFEGWTRHHVTPYALAGFGGARISPSTHLLYADGILPNADPTQPMPAIGTDVTSQIVAAGGFTQPSPSSALMLALGGGAQLGISKRLIADVGYRYSRIAADLPLHAQGITFGLGVKF